MRVRAADRRLHVAAMGGGARLGALWPGVVRGLAGSGGESAFGLDIALDRADPDAPLTVALLGRQAAGAPLPVAVTAGERAEALDGADVVLCLDLPDSCLAPGALLAGCDWADAPQAGAGGLAAAVLAGPAVLALAREVAARAPAALLVMMGVLPDVLAGAARRRFGVGGLRAVGMGPHLGDLRSRLAALFAAAPERVALVHGGVHRLGWVLRFAVDGRDGYGELAERIAGDPALADVWELTGLIPTVCDGGWPWGGALPVGPGGSGTGGAGRALGRLLRAVATGDPDVIGLDVPFSGEALSWTPEVTAEVPAVVVGNRVDPVAVGPLPPGVDGLPRMLALQRGLASDYLANPDPAVLLRALAATPHWGTPARWRRLVGALQLHAEPGLAQAVRP